MESNNRPIVFSPTVTRWWVLDKPSYQALPSSGNVQSHHLFVNNGNASWYWFLECNCGMTVGLKTQSNIALHDTGLWAWDCPHSPSPVSGPEQPGHELLSTLTISSLWTGTWTWRFCPPLPFPSVTNCTMFCSTWWERRLEITVPVGWALNTLSSGPCAQCKSPRGYVQCWGMDVWPLLYLLSVAMALISFWLHLVFLVSLYFSWFSCSTCSSVPRVVWVKL